MVPGRSAARAGPGATRRNRSTSARAEVIETSPSSGRPSARAMPAPARGTTAGSRCGRAGRHRAGEGAGPRYRHRRRRPLDQRRHVQRALERRGRTRCRRATRLTRPLTTTVASRNGAVRRSRVTWLPSKPIRPFTGSLVVACSPTRAANALGLDGAAGADAEPVAGSRTARCSCRAPRRRCRRCDRRSRRRGCAPTSPRRSRWRGTSGGGAPDGGGRLTIWPPSRTSVTTPSSTTSDDSRSVPLNTAHGSATDTRRAAKTGSAACPSADRRDAGQRRAAREQVVVEVGGGQVEPPQPLDLPDQPGPHARLDRRRLDHDEQEGERARPAPRPVQANRLRHAPPPHHMVGVRGARIQGSIRARR